MGIQYPSLIDTFYETLRWASAQTAHLRMKVWIEINGGAIKSVRRETGS